MTTYTYYPKGTCSKQMEVDLEDGVIKDVRVLGGCNGNLQGISSLVRGMKAADAIERMRGIRRLQADLLPRPALHRAGKGAGGRKKRKVNPTGSKELAWMEKEET